MPSTLSKQKKNSEKQKKTQKHKKKHNSNIRNSRQAGP